MPFGEWTAGFAEAPSPSADIGEDLPTSCASCSERPAGEEEFSAIG
jgi:hypothetical protein